jgi:hypothetical protein
MAIILTAVCLGELVTHFVAPDLLASVDTV